MRLYSSQIEHVLLTAIDRAKESIDIIVYRLSDPTVIGALSRAQKRGVRVSILTDPGAKQIGPFNWRKKKVRGLMHEKILVIDDKMTFIGSANLTEDSLKAHKNMMAGIYSEELPQKLREGESPQRICIGGYGLEVWRLPALGALDRLLERVNSAEKRLELSMYTLTEPRLIDALIAAKRRGVDVQIALDRNSWKAIELLRDQGLDVQIAPRYPLTHDKHAKIDGSSMVFGSANWTKAAFSKNQDLLVILDEHCFANKL